MKEIQLRFVKYVKDHLQLNSPLIQVIIGPRQVGKTTGIKQLLEKFVLDEQMYVSADGSISRPHSWLEEQWHLARAKSPQCLLVIDEIQKVENWSEIIKKLWDGQARQKQKIKLILLGSSSLMLQDGLTESLTGRFLLHRVFHWDPLESEQAYAVSLEQFLVLGGYPGSYVLAQTDWLTYMKTSIVDTVIGRDILSQSRVKSPALFRQCFDLALSYGGQEISYNKLLGQLQEKGNVELVKHYLDLFERAFLLKQLYKFTEKKRLSRTSSPKILPLCPALYSLQFDGELTDERKGRAFEITIGSMLARLPGELFYWREKNFEVDYIYKFKNRVVAIEVKNGHKKKVMGVSKFGEKFPKAEVWIVTPENYRSILKQFGYDFSALPEV